MEFFGSGPDFMKITRIIDPVSRPPDSTKRTI
jgi:hypothetical protein